MALTRYLQEAFWSTHGMSFYGRHKIFLYNGRE